MLSKPPFSYLETLNKVDDCIDINSDLAEAILDAGLASVGLSPASQPDDTKVALPEWHNAATKIDLDKARSTVHQMFRDWSAEGAVEREACYGPVMQYLYEEFGLQRQNGEAIEVLVPGAGLGRLVFDLCREGYLAEGNEISYHQLLTSSFILNHTSKADEWALHPFALSFSNQHNRADQLRKVTIPDVHPGGTVSAGGMGMTTGDFVTLYSDEENKSRFDAVATVFFIDTAPNVLTYIDTIWCCLKPGGIWVNLGPLLWHFEEKQVGQSNGGDDEEGSSRDKADRTGYIGEAGSFEPSADEVKLLVEQAGFIVEKYEMHSTTTGYVQNGRSMLRSMYEPCRWVARKPTPAPALQRSPDTPNIEVETVS
ncbi:hypothetical protein FH972_022006 [Carpinus fangiana]|uniref:carnosine N-methyltransferase n=1 Tax=Carpinus fangiana TaxID=176857 RepID=A0A5N6KRC3_9ROSI|nr:hypothetical protein FH972_022006 [Carpinus fangiana]